MKIGTFCSAFRVAGGELPERMRYQNNSGSSLLLSLRSDPLDFMVLAFCAVVALKDCHYSRDSIKLNCYCSLVADSGDSLHFRSNEHADTYTINDKRDVVFGSEHTFFWYSTVHLLDSKYSLSKASFKFHVDGEEGASSNAVVIKCGVHPLSDNCDNNNPTSSTKSTWSPSFIRIGQKIEEVEEQ